jgi:hypothetical protein
MEKPKEIKYDLKNSRNKLKLRENCYGEIAQKKKGGYLCCWTWSVIEYAL